MWALTSECPLLGNRFIQVLPVAAVCRPGFKKAVWVSTASHGRGIRHPNNSRQASTAALSLPSYSKLQRLLRNPQPSTHKFSKAAWRRTDPDPCIDIRDRAAPDLASRPRFGLKPTPEKTESHPDIGPNGSNYQLQAP